MQPLIKTYHRSYINSILAIIYLNKQVLNKQVCTEKDMISNLLLLRSMMMMMNKQE